MTFMERVRDRLGNLRQRARGVVPFATGVLAALLALFLYNEFFVQPPLTQKQVNASIASAMASATPRPPDSVGVYQMIQPSLVLIETGDALGSGVIVDNAGDILTSLHVVEGANKISLVFADGTHTEGTIASAQPEIDIAVLQPKELPQQFVPAILGNPRALQVGDEAYVVGNPFGLYSSMSAGVISGFNRTFKPTGENKPELKGLIQFDAAANPGNSGGPLLNSGGQVVGIVTGLVNPSDGNFFVGIAFAVPINVAGGGANLPPY